MNFFTISNAPDFSGLPWVISLTNWTEQVANLVELPRGLSRHPVVFINLDGEAYALKELPAGVAQREFELLTEMQKLHLPVVTPVGYVGAERKSILITRYLEHSLPYRSLFMSNSLLRYREHLLDAIAGLMVQLHLAGVYWGDCSLSNALFRRDAGALQAYLVDAETAEYYPKDIAPTLRFYDLEIMEENIDGDLCDLKTASLLPAGAPFADTGVYIRLRYQSLWTEITREDIIKPGEHYRIQERIRVLNELGFSVKDVELAETTSGEQLRLRVIVTDRSFHHDQLLSLTGLDVREHQAQQMMNEIQETKATLSNQYNRSTSLSEAAFHWLENIYRPVINHLQSVSEIDGAKQEAKASQTGQSLAEDMPEIYCQILEHKWFLSERAQRDVGHQAATQDYIQRFVIQEE